LPVPLCAAVLVFGGCAGPQTDSEREAFASLRHAFPEAKMHRLHDGVVYAVASTTAPTRVHILAIDLTQPDIVVRPVLGHDRVDGGAAARETIVSMARRTNAIALINGDYFSDEMNVEALTVADGHVLYAPDPPKRSSIVIGDDGAIRIGRFGRDLPPSARWQAVGGGPKLMEGGAFRWDSSIPQLINGEDFPKVPPGRWDGRHPLTAYCETNRPKMLLLVAIDGRRKDVSIGMNPWELGQLLASLGCKEAMRMDGGGSTGMTVNGKLKTLAPEGFPDGRPIGISLGVFRRQTHVSP
ncbi:MAG: hypothetical protein COV48_10225, partial [Elusimicrobia bacterium CG11_big_fil_rev_8_21_14_0_20_64_6]